MSRPVETLLSYGLTSSEVAALGSERLHDIANLLLDADRYIGDHEKALRWLRSSIWAMGNRTPLEVLAKDNGIAIVRLSLVAIAFGGVA